MEKVINRREGFVKRNWGMIYSLISLIFDMVVLNLSLLVSIWLRFGHLRDLKYYTKAQVFVNIMFMLVSLGLGVYRSRYNLSRDNLRYYYKRVVFYLAILTMAFLYLIKGQDYSRAVIFTTFFIFYVFLELAHSMLLRMQTRLVRKQVIGFKTIIIGSDEWTYKFSQRISYVFGGFFHIQGYVKNTMEENPSLYQDLQKFVLGTIDELEMLLEKHHPDVVFIVSRTMDIDKYQRLCDICKSHSVKLKMVSPKVSDIFISSRIRDVYGVSLVLETWRIHFQRFNSRVKRIFDISFLLLIMPVILPVGLIIALLIKLTSRGPVFFKQKRSLSKGGQEFYFYKFRSMYRDAEAQKLKLVEQNETDGALFKIKKDPRVTWFGRIIRKFSLDELPQFINVMKGEMAIVGPRPLPVDDFENIKESGMSMEWHTFRGSVKPGITGLWQVSGRSNLSFEEMLYLDLYYIEHQSIFFDLEILFETLPTVFFGKGAY